MEIVFSGEVSEDVRARALRAHLRHRLSLTPVTTLVLSVVLLNILARLVMALTGDAEPGTLRTVALLILPFAAIFGGGFHVERRRFRKGFPASNVGTRALQNSDW